MSLNYLNDAYKMRQEQSPVTLQPINPPADEPGPHRIRGYSLATLCEQYRELAPPVIEGLLREGETCNVIAAPKVGKSWFVYNVALSVVMGWSLFGRFPTRPGKVLLVDNELHPATLARRIPFVADAMGVANFENRWKEDLEVWPLRGNLKSLPQLGREFDTIERGEYQLVIMDAKYRFAIEGTSENDNAAEARFYNTIDHYAEKLGAAFLLVHHSSKGNQSGKSVTDVGAGAGAQSRAADCHMVLREHEQEGHVVLDAAVRSFEPVTPLVLKWQFPLWEPAEDMDPFKLKGTKTGQKEAEDKRDAEGKKQIEDALLRVNRATRSKLRVETGISPDRINKLLGMMVREGSLERESVVKKGNQTDEFRLSNTIE